MEVSDKEQREYDARAKSYENAILERRLELNLFWQRSLFFWGFIASAFVAYAALKDDVLLRFAVSAFGLVCSFSWTLANRGSKYWYEAWEQKVESIEYGEFENNLYVREEPVRNPSFWGGRRYSVTRIAIGLSDFTAFIWLLLFFLTAQRQDWSPTNYIAIALIWCSIPYCYALWRRGRFFA